MNVRGWGSVHKITITSFLCATSNERHTFLDLKKFIGQNRNARTEHIAIFKTHLALVPLSTTTACFKSSDMLS